MLAPLFDSRPSPFDTRRTISRGIGRVARDHQVLAVALVPAERRDAVVVAVEDARPGWPTSSTGRIASQRDEPVRAVADPAGHRVDRAGAHAAGEDRVGEAVDLDDHQARRVGLRRGALEQQALDQQAVVRVAAVDAQDRR